MVRCWDDEINIIYRNGWLDVEINIIYRNGWLDDEINIICRNGWLDVEMMRSQHLTTHFYRLYWSQHLTTHFYRLYWPPMASNRSTWWWPLNMPKHAVLLTTLLSIDQLCLTPLPAPYITYTTGMPQLKLQTTVVYFDRSTVEFIQLNNKNQRHAHFLN